MNGSTPGIQNCHPSNTMACDDGLRAAESAIYTEQLALQYHGTTAIEQVSLEVPVGAITAIVGPSGCGKSSFLICLNRLTDLIPACRVEGTIRIGSIDVLDPDTDVIGLRRRVGMIFQKPNPFPLSIRENLELALREFGTRDRTELDQIVHTSLVAVGLWDEVKDRLNRPALALSGGQQQRLCLARALALEPQVLLLDEPCSALDPISTAVVEELIKELGRHYTVLMVTHNLAQARRVADFAALFWKQGESGRLIEHAPIEAFFQAPVHELTNAYVNGRSG